MKVLEVPANSRIFLGLPAQPLPRPMVDRIADALYVLDGVEQVHLPQCFALGVTESPALVAVVVVGANTSLKRIGKQAKKALSKLLPPDQTLDVWPISFDSAFATAVQQVGCLVERDPFCLPAFRKPRPWWHLLRVG